ncbi:YciI family protein [Variovorax sp. S2]|uniref:YciI family protein n=1 Tax=Variovorax sp. S12S4 TaxID=3029170 RepID=UPI00215B9D49|nr:YciI family protein [Variovorax sp. S12S4]MCR8958783.1 YciI family protein [Variovorax sp. S12S4]
MTVAIGTKASSSRAWRSNLPYKAASRLPIGTQWRMKMKYFLARFLPPRADFLATMSPDEVNLMKEHGAFLNDLLQKGVVVAHGPVADPAGGWGLSLYQVEDGQDVRALAQEDPMVRSGGACYEIFSMPHLQVRV